MNLQLTFQVSAAFERSHPLGDGPGRFVPAQWVVALQRHVGAFTGFWLSICLSVYIFICIYNYIHIYQTWTLMLAEARAWTQIFTIVTQMLILAQIFISTVRLRLNCTWYFIALRPFTIPYMARYHFIMSYHNRYIRESHHIRDECSSGRNPKPLSGSASPKTLNPKMPSRLNSDIQVVQL